MLVIIINSGTAGSSFCHLK